MLSHNRSFHRARPNSGFLTIEFMFALVIGIAFSMILFALTFTLGVVEITQYMTFASARSHLAGNENPAAQKRRAVEKFSMLTVGSGSNLSFLFKPQGWFEVAQCAGTSCKGLDIRSGKAVDKNFNADLGAGDASNREVFMGVSTPFQSKLLALKLPLIGATTDDEASSFKTSITTILIREPTYSECHDLWNNQRRAALKTLDSAKDFMQVGKYVPMEDNGC